MSGFPWVNGRLNGGFTLIEHLQQDGSTPRHVFIGARSHSIDRDISIRRKDSRIGTSFGESGIVDLCQRVRTDILDVVHRYVIVVYRSRIVKRFDTGRNDTGVDVGVYLSSISITQAWVEDGSMGQEKPTWPME